LTPPRDEQDNPLVMPHARLHARSRAGSLAAAIAVSVGLVASTRAQTPAAPPNLGLTAVKGIKVGHFTRSERPTGCTVILPPPDTIASVDVRGSAPATRETDLLNPVNNVQVVHAVVLSGGSAFGLDSATGVMRFLEEQGIGYEARGVKIPIVPGASLIDLAFGGNPKIRPDADCGYKAAAAATDAPVAEGNVGAGAGATVGKLGGLEGAMKAGIGTSAITLPNGLIVSAIAAVNAAGDIIDPATGQVIAGMRTAGGKALADARKHLRTGSWGQPPRAGENTTLGVIATNAKLTKVEAQKVAQMAHDGYARAISPVHTPGDGDTIFALATGSLDLDVNVGIIGALAADAMAEAIVRGATQATALGGLPAARDLGTLPGSPRPRP
jgi:L-aminopeptidase/D-esterase-like protein